MKNEIKEMNFSEMLFNRDERLLDYITNLQEENERLKVNCNLGYEELKVMRDYKSRIKKAIEYINHAQNYTKEKYTYVNGDNLLDILQEVGKDEKTN